MLSRAFAHTFPLSLFATSVVRAGVNIIKPSESAVCTGGQPCQVQWTEDSLAPFLPDIGQCNISLHFSRNPDPPVQVLGAFNVAIASGLTFVPDPQTSPNGQYYMMFSTDSIAGNTSESYRSLSHNFTLNGMAGATPTLSGISTPTVPNTRSTTSASSSASLPAATFGAADRIGTSTLLGGLAALLSLSGILAF